MTYTPPVLLDEAAAFKILDAYILQRKQTAEQYSESVRIYAQTVIGVQVYLAHLAQDYRDACKVFNLLGMAKALQDAEKAAWALKYLDTDESFRYQAWTFKRGVMYTDLSMLWKLPPPPEPKSVVVKPVVVKDHVALLTGTVARFEAGRQQAEREQVLEVT